MEKIMRINIYFSILTVLFTANFLFGNVPAPRPPQKKVIWVQQDYSDFVFYLCTYSQTHDLKMDENTFKVTPIELTTKNPLIIKRHSPPEYEVPDYLNSHLVAVAKSINEKIKPNLNEKLLNVVKSGQDESGIYDANIPREYKMCKDSLCTDTDFNSILVVEFVDNKGLQFKGFDKKGDKLVEQKADSQEKSSLPGLNNNGTWIGIILFSIALAICGIFFLKRNSRK
jgi:hypothetical protein